MKILVFINFWAKLQESDTRAKILCFLDDFGIRFVLIFTERAIFLLDSITNEVLFAVFFLYVQVHVLHCVNAFKRGGDETICASWIS